MRETKEKALIYPYDMEFSPTIRYQELLIDYEIATLVSPNGWGFCGKDAGSVDASNDIGISVTHDFDNALASCETVIFVEGQYQLDFEKLIYPKILKALDKRKNVVCIIDLDQGIRNKLKEMFSNKGCDFKYFGHKKDNGYKIKANAYQENLLEINSPVIFVVGIAERTNKFYVQLSLRKYFIKNGYKVSQIGTKKYCELFGFHSFPEFMYDSNIPEAYKVVLFNRFIKSLEKKENPDVIIIGIPGGVMPFNNKHTNKFGILAFEVSQALTPDASILSLLFEDYKPETFEVFARSIRYKLGFDLDCINISNSHVDWSKATEFLEISYLKMESTFVDDKIKKMNRSTLPVFNILNKQDCENMSNTLINKLINYSYTQSI